MTIPSSLKNYIMNETQEAPVEKLTSSRLPSKAYAAMGPSENLVPWEFPSVPAQVPAFNLIFQGRNLAGSLIGGIAETQEMLDFCAAHNITADIELINI